jgi:ADP-heptose:LPS heptosyltransferase
MDDEYAGIRWETVPYFHGRILDVCKSPYKVFPHWIGVDSGRGAGIKGFDIFASQSCDGVFSNEIGEVKEWFRVLKPGGHLMLHVHGYDEVLKALEPFQWDLIEYHQDKGFFVFRKCEGRSFSYKNPKPEKTCAVVRYGAIGDMIQVSSILPGLKAQGYWIDLYCQAGNGYEAIKNDPNVDRFIIQGRDEVPNGALEEFWNYTRKKYDKWVNLCESVEGTLLASPGRAPYEWPNEVRAAHMDRNYLEWTHALAEVPPPYSPKFYSTLEEKAWAKEKARSYGRKNVLWSLAGSSGHKVWPHLDSVIATLMLETDFHVVLVGDELCQVLEMGWEKEKRVHCQSGKWSIRESMAFAEVADLVIGTETGLLNAAGHMDTPKIVTLSHSSKEMLTKHWKNVIALEQPAGIGCNKHPCRQLHGGEGFSPWQDCPQHEETGTSLCQFHIGPEMMLKAIRSVL